MSNEVQATNAPVEAAQEVGFKVFVGNLAFATKDADLQEVFGKIGQVSDAQIINRGARSLGYGFVTYVVEADAHQAVSSLDKSEIAGRQVNVEFAKPPTATPVRAPREPKARAPATTEAGAPAVNGEGAVDGEVKPKKARAKRPSRAKGRRPRTDGETEEAGDAPADVNGATSALAATTLDGPAALNADGTPATAGRGRGSRRGAARTGVAPVRRGPPTGEPSKTLLFVANLPFSVTDEGLKALFEGYKVASARVVTKKFGAGEGKSKGFGFVDFEEEAEQQRALESVQGKEIDGRAVQLKVAIAQEEKKEGAAEDEADATIVAS